MFVCISVHLPVYMYLQYQNLTMHIDALTVTVKEL